MSSRKRYRTRPSLVFVFRRVCPAVSRFCFTNVYDRRTDSRSWSSAGRCRPVLSHKSQRSVALRGHGKPCARPDTVDFVTSFVPEKHLSIHDRPSDRLRAPSAWSSPRPRRRSVRKREENDRGRDFWNGTRTLAFFRPSILNGRLRTCALIGYLTSGKNDFMKGVNFPGQRSCTSSRIRFWYRSL